MINFSRWKENKESKQITESTLSFIHYMLLYNKIELSDIPFELRTLSTSTYIIACRVSRNLSLQRYQQDLNLLLSDAKRLPSFRQDSFLKTYQVLYDNMAYVEDGQQNGTSNQKAYSQ